jgi:hypothetical protein
MTVSRPPVLPVGDEVVVDGSAHTVTSLSGTQVRLADMTGVESACSLADLFSSAGFRVVTQARGALPPQGLLDSLAPGSGRRSTPHHGMSGWCWTTA